MGSVHQGSFNEIFYTQKLADNDNIVRNRTLKKLKNFLKLKSQQQGFSYEDLIKIWKGLYYCMYMTDKPLVQEQLAEDVSCLIHEFSSSSQRLLFFKVALDTFAREWNGIDKFRRDKFFMLFTRVLRQYLFCLRNFHWSIDEVKQMSEILESSIVCPYDEANKKPIGLKMHLVSIILEELAKVGRESVPEEVLVTIICPFFKVIAVSRQSLYITAIRNNILDFLIKHSELGILHQEDLTLNELELAKNEDVEDDPQEVEEDREFVMDPRAGGVDVYLPLLKPNYKTIASALRWFASIPEVPRKNRQLLNHHVKQFLKMAKNIYPFANPVGKKINNFNDISRKRMVRKAVREFQASKFTDKPSGKRKLEEERTSAKRRKKRSKSTDKKAKLSKEEVKKALVKDWKRKSALKSKLSKLDKIIGSIEKETEGQTVPSNKSKFRVSPQKSLKATVATINKGWQVSKLVSESTTPNEVLTGKRKRDKKIRKRKGNEVSQVAKTPKVSGTEKDTSTPTTNTPVERAQKQLGSKEHNGHLKSELTGKRSKKVMSRLQKGVPSSVPTARSLVKPTKQLKNENRQWIHLTRNIKKGLNGFIPNDDITVQKRKPKDASAAVPGKLQNEEAPKICQNDPWKDDLQEGETEIVIMSKKFAKKTRSPNRLNIVMKKTPKMNTKGKTLKINLCKNKEHDWKDYNKAVKSSPRIPFSANKKPSGSVLKSAAASQNLTKRKSFSSKINSIKSK